MPPGPENLKRLNIDASARGPWQDGILFDAIQKLAHIGYCEWDYRNGDIVSCTPSYAEIFSLGSEEILAPRGTMQGFLQRLHPDDRERYLHFCESQLPLGSYEIEYRILHGDAKIRHIKEAGIANRDENGDIVTVVNLVQDITEYASLRRELEEGAAKLKMAARTAQLGYWHFDEENDEYIDISEEYAAIYGYTVSEFLDTFRTLEADMELVHPDDREALYQSYSTSIDGRYDYSYRIRHRDGHWVHVREISVDIQDENGDYRESIGTLQDISELKQAQVRAERANQAKNDFLSRMSHELRTPLNAILGFSELFQSDLKLDRQQRSQASAIHQAGQHLLELINEILDLSRLESGNIEVSIEPVSLQKVLRYCIGLVENPAAERSIEIDFDAAACAGILVEADVTRLKQVFLNLLSNAVKYNRDDGLIRISAREETATTVCIAIADSGCGIAPDRLEELFEPFNRLGAERTETEGTGIGLSITRQLVELMHGELEVESTPGSGSVFKLRLGRAAAHSPAGEAALDESGSKGPALDAAVENEARILVAEDNIVNRELIASQLQNLGYQADFALTGKQALEMWQAANYPLLLTDIRMPEMDGFELIAAIRKRETGDSRMPIVAATASAMENDTLRCLEAGADQVISKPMNLDDLRCALQKWLGQGDREQGRLNNDDEVGDEKAGAAIDLALLTQMVGDDFEVQRGLLTTYLDHLPKSLFDIRQAYAWHNFEQMQEYAHKLKSSSRSIGAVRISKLCDELELACNESREADITILLPRLAQAVESTTAFLENFFEQGRSRGSSTSTASVLTPAKTGTRVMLIDDDPVVHSVVPLILNDLGVRRVRSATSGRQALKFLADPSLAFHIVICDLNMPGMDGIEFTRHLAKLNFAGSLVLLSGEDQRLLRSVEKLAIEHGLQVLGVLEKPVTPVKMAQLLAQFERDRLDSTVTQLEIYSVEEIQNAIDRDELDTFFQPKVNIGSGRIIGVEALARWRHPQKGVIGPNQFIPVAEENGLIQNLTRVLCRKALKHAAQWKSRGVEVDIALNISVDALDDLDWPNAMAEQVRSLDLRPETITLEITESRLMEHMRVALDILGRLSLKRFKLSIDDFGTGYSSMEQLQRIPFSELKIDRAFVRNAARDNSAQAILESSVLLAGKLGMTVVAEGVETLQDWELVAKMGCDQVQGYYIAKPMPGERFCDWLARRQSPPAR